MRFIFFIFCVSFFCDFLTAQTPPQLEKVAYPSPNVQAIQKYGEIPVSPYTGVPNISIPLYTVQYKDIQLPISISYHASGIKVSEEASRVGLGWVLNAGGTISRNIIGEDDWFDFNYFNSSFNDFPDLSDGKGPTNSIQTGCNLECYDRYGDNTIWHLDMNSYLNATPAYDFQPDQYFFNLPSGKSGKFVLKRNQQAVIQSQQPLQITPTDYDGKTWKIVDEEGYTYEFNIFETAKGYAGNPHTTMSAWYLTKVISPTGNIIALNYTTKSDYTTPTGTWSETREDYIFPPQIPLTSGHGAFGPTNFPPQAGWANGQDYTTVLLSSIDFETGTIQFNYSTRTDIKNDYKLDNIMVYSKTPYGERASTPLKTVALSYDYFSGGNDPAFGNGYTNNGYDALRLKLAKVQESGTIAGQTNTNAPYLFTYKESGAEVLPSKTSFARDHWGYYNGKVGRSSLIPTFTPNAAYNNSEKEYHLGIQGNERDADPSFMQAFSLQRITYPTGGSTEFTYESNTFDEQLSQVNDPSASGSTYSVVKDEGILQYDYSGNHWSGTNTVDMSNEYLSPQNTTLPLTLAVTYRFSTSPGCDNIDHSVGKLTFNIYNENGQDMIGTKDIQLFYPCNGTNTEGCLLCGGANDPTATYRITIPLDPGKYRVEVFVDNSYQTKLQDIKFDFVWSTQVNSNNPNGFTYSYGGGLRIKRITEHSATTPSAPDKITKYLYHFQKDQDNNGSPEEYSYGIRMSKPNYTNFTKAVETNEEHGETMTYYTTADVYHMMRSADSDIPLNGSAGGCVVGYSNVTVLYGENGENGKTEYTYHNQPDIITPYVSDINSFAMKPPYSSTIPDPLNGSLLSQTDYKKAGTEYKKVKEITNTYTTSFNNTASRVENLVYGIESVPTVTYNSSINNGTFSRGGTQSGPCDRLELSYQTIQSEWDYLSRSVARTYDQTDETKFTETQTDYSYDNPAHYQLTRTTTQNSKGEILTTHMSYPLDFKPQEGQSSEGIRYLINNHIITAPVETYISGTKPDGSEAATMTAVLNEYKNNMPKPSTSYVLETAKPVADFIPLARNADYNSKNSQYAGRIVYDAYDANGNLLQQHKTNDVNHSYIWDYYNGLPVAEAVNAAQAAIAYTSFEADGSGNWVFDRENIKHEKGITGLADYILDNAHPIRWQTERAGNYIVSCWLKEGEGSVSVYNTPGTVITSKNGWTLLRFKLNSVTRISVEGNGMIDELRLYPAGARMTTYTYEPLVGLTSACDANDHVNYYEYDGLGRLKQIRDADNNIVKKFDYQYQTTYDPNWQNTGTTTCQTDEEGHNTGYLMQQQEDMNLQSPTYGTYRWKATATQNFTSCPLYQANCTLEINSSDYTNVVKGIYSNGNGTTLYVTFRPNIVMQSGTVSAYQVAKIENGCFPATDQTYHISSGATTDSQTAHWTVVIKTSGQMEWRLDSGQVAAGTTIGSGNLSY